MSHFLLVRAIACFEVYREDEPGFAGILYAGGLSLRAVMTVTIK